MAIEKVITSVQTSIQNIDFVLKDIESAKDHVISEILASPDTRRSRAAFGRQPRLYDG